MTKDINRRIREHNYGKITSTEARRPLELVYYETVEDRKKAREREKFLKSGCGREFLKRKIDISMVGVAQVG